MTLHEKFQALTPEQREKFNTVKDSAGLDAFLTETGLELTADEKEQVTEFITTGKQPLSDDDLNAVAGGADPRIIAAWRGVAEGEGRPTHVGMKNTNFMWRNANCPKCNGIESLFCSSMTATGYFRETIISSRYPSNYDCVDTKCYICDYHFGTCELIAGTWGDVYIQNWGR